MVETVTRIGVADLDRPGQACADKLPGTDFVVPVGARGIGNVISSPAAPALIDGVQVQPFPVWSDDRGRWPWAAGWGPGQLRQPVLGVRAQKTQKA